MRISSRTSVGWLCALRCLASAPALSAGVKYRSSQEALDQGIGAFNGGYYEIAIPALEYAVKGGNGTNSFLRRYYLARIYSDNNGARPTTPRPTSCSEASPRRTPTSIPRTTGARHSSPRLMTRSPAIPAQRNCRRSLSIRTRRAPWNTCTTPRVFGDEDAQFELAKL